MVSSGVVDYDPRDGTYALPPEHAAFLTRAATPANLAVYAQYIPLLGAVEDDVFACFPAGDIRVSSLLKNPVVSCSDSSSEEIRKNRDAK